MKDILKKIIHYFAETAKPELIASLIVMFIIAVLAIVLGSAIKKADPKKAPKGIAFAAETVVSFTDNQGRIVFNESDRDYYCIEQYGYAVVIYPWKTDFLLFFCFLRFIFLQSPFWNLFLDYSSKADPFAKCAVRKFAKTTKPASLSPRL